MGGKVLKPKIQAYVEQQWFDEFEVYRASHNLNQSKALEKILAEFFSGSSSTASPSDELNTVIAPSLIDTLRAELAELKQEVEQRLELVESRLAIESAAPLANSASGLVHLLNGLAAKSVIHQSDSADILNESALPLTRLATESAALSIHSDATPTIPLAELAAESVVGLNRLVAESVAKSAVELAAAEAIAIDTLGGNLEPATVSNALAEATTALDDSIESAVSSVSESAIVEDAIALNLLEDILEPTVTAAELVELGAMLNLKDNLESAIPTNDTVEATDVSTPNPLVPGLTPIGAEAIAFNPIEEVAPVEVEEDEIASDSEDILKLTEKCATTVALSEDAIASNSTGILEPATPFSEPVEEEELVVESIEPTGKKPKKRRTAEEIEAIKNLVEANLDYGQQIEAKKLANLTGLTVPGIRHRRDAGTLHELSLQLVPDSKPEKFERI